MKPATAAAFQPDLLDLDPDPALIVLGRDATNKPHASWLSADEAEAGTAAAALMGMHAEPVNTDALRKLAGQLPRGKVFGSGKAFVPFVKASLFDELIAEVPLAAQLKPLRLVKADGEGAASNPVVAIRPKAGGKPPEPHRPNDWGSIAVGDLVLASESDAEGWFACIVLKANPDNTFEMRWRDYELSEFPPFTRHRHQLALLHPLPKAVA